MSVGTSVNNDNSTIYILYIIDSMSNIIIKRVQRNQYFATNELPKCDLSL